MSSDYRKTLLVDGSAYNSAHSAGTPDSATMPMPGRPRNTSVNNDAMPSSLFGYSSIPVASMRRVRFAPTADAEDTDSDDLEVFIAEMTRQSDAEAEALDRLTQSSFPPIIEPANERLLGSRGASSDSDESDIDDIVNPDVSDCERSGQAEAKIYAPFLSLSQKDTPADDSASTPKIIRVKRRTDDEKENYNPRQWVAVSSADRGPEITDFTLRCAGPRSPPKYPDWAADIAEEREKLAAAVLAETLDKLTPCPPMNFDSEVRISRRLRDASVVLPKSKRRKMVHVSTHEA
ncbi:hypothetical protein EV121DRAFT_201219 [Schizophyllum commune]